MAQPHVAREPSMDEILASIRRIIENNEQLPFGDAAGGTYEHHSGSGDDYVDEETIVAEFHAEEERHFSVAAPAAEPAPAASPAAQPVLSLADVAARVRAASERNSVQREPEPANRAPVAEPAPMAQPAPVAVRENPVRAEAEQGNNPTVTARMTAGAGHVPQRQPQPDVQRAVPAEEMRPEDMRARPVAAFEQPARAGEPDNQPSRDMTAIVDITDGSLLSADVGAKVAESFGALTQALEAGPRRSFDEIAEEMLRPMLRDWLDDNLPTLVERLVREEIERVARGPRR